MTQEQWTIDQYLKELPSTSIIFFALISFNKSGFHVAVSAEEINEHAKALLSNARLRILVSGNVYKDVRCLTDSDLRIYTEFLCRRP